MAVARGKALGQAVTPRQRSAKPAETWSYTISIPAGARVRWTLAAAGSLALMFLLGWGSYRIARSSAFALAAVEVRGQDRVRKEAIEQMVRQTIGESVLLASLGDLQRNLETLTWVKEAQVTRILPDTIRVRIVERKPLLLACPEGRLGAATQSNLFWMDDEGVLLDSYDPSRDRDLPPVVSGFSLDRSEAARLENLERIKVYKNLLWAFDSSEPKYSSNLESVDLTRTDNVAVHLAGSRVVLNLGEGDFRMRFVRGMEVLRLLQRHDPAAAETLQISDPRVLKQADQISRIDVSNPARMAIEFFRETPSRTEGKQ